MDAEFWYCDEELLVGCCLCSKIFVQSQATLVHRLRAVYTVQKYKSSTNLRYRRFAVVTRHHRKVANLTCFPLCQITPWLRRRLLQAMDSYEPIQHARSAFESSTAAYAHPYMNQQTLVGGAGGRGSQGGSRAALLAATGEVQGTPDGPALCFAALHQGQLLCLLP